MIDIIDFRRQLSIETAKLQLHQASSTFLYAHANDKNIPIYYNSKYNILQWLDRWTQERAAQILKDDLIELNGREIQLTESMEKIYYKFANSISTTYKNFIYSKGGVYETIFDYRYINKYFNGDFNIVDYGAGDGRHGCAFNIFGNRGKYYAIDVMEILYTLQNNLFGYIASEKFYETLDYDLENIIFNAKKTTEGSLIHIPAWKTDKIEIDKIDVFLANHILDELPKEDLYILLRFAKKNIRKGGIVYSRGTIHNAEKQQLKNYHGCDIYKEFQVHGFELVEDTYFPSQCYNVIVWKRI